MMRRAPGVLGDPGQYSRISSGAARRIWNMRKSMSIILSVLLLAIGFCHLAQASGPADRFKALGPDKSQATKASLFYPNDFEAAAARHPDPNGLVFFSLCRRAPFTSTTLYSPFSSGNVDAIVGDTTFPLVDGTQCYEPQNEQNIVVNPTNSQNIVTTANEYGYGFQALIYYSTDGGNTFSDVLLPHWDPATGWDRSIHPCAGRWRSCPGICCGRHALLFRACVRLQFHESDSERGRSGCFP